MKKGKQDRRKVAAVDPNTLTPAQRTRRRAKLTAAGFIPAARRRQFGIRALEC
jgi:hypothetical protein